MNFQLNPPLDTSLQPQSTPPTLPTLQLLARTDSPAGQSHDGAADQMQGTSTGGKGKRAASSTLETDGEAPPRVKRKRQRAALSCTECKRRKTKCSRTLPCELCIRRNEQHKCRWEDSAVDPAPQPFALATEHELLKQRVAQLEAIILKTHGPGALRHLPQSSGDQDSAEVDELDSDQGARDSDTEDAALVLEELALGRNMTRIGTRKRRVLPGWVERRLLRRSAEVKAHVLLFREATNPFPGTTPTAGLHDPTMSAAMRSLLVPPPEPRRKLVLDDIWNSLPQSKLLLDYLVQAYFSRADWAWHLHHSPSFMAEYEAFGKLVQQGRRDLVDPLWIAVLSMTLCLAVANLDGPVHSPLVNISQEDLNSLPQQYCDAAQSALECGDWTGVPRIRTLQTIALFCPFFLYKGTPAIGLRLQTYLGAAIRMCQQLGLHQLGADPTCMPPEDVALPSGINTLRREIPLRLFRNLLFVEYISIDKIKPGLPPTLISSPFPGNFDDADLNAEGIVLPRPDDVATDTSFDHTKWKIALIQRRFNERINGDEPLEYETTILDLDKGYREIIDNLPTRFLPSYIPPLGEPLTTLWQRSMALQTINSRLVRLHRPFMSRGYREVKYRTSTDSAIAAARHILNCQQSLDRAPLIKQGFQLLTVQGAVVVLYMDLWTTFPENVTEGADWRLIADVVPFFERSLLSREASVRKIAQQSLSAINLLSQAIEARREQALARVAAGGAWGKEGDVEPYGRLLKRTGASVSTTAAMGLEGPKAAASHIFSDRGHDFNVNAGGDPATNVEDLKTDPLTLASSQWMGQTDPPLTTAQTFDLGSDWASSGGLAADFDLASLGGPEFAAATFDWTSWTTEDQFASTLGPNL